MAKIPFVTKFSKLGIHHNEFDGGIYPNFPNSPLSRIIQEDQIKIPAHVDFIGNVFVSTGGEGPEVLMKVLNPSDHQNKIALTGIVNHPELFGKFNTPFPLVYREAAKRTAYRYNILRHRMEDREFVFHQRRKEQFPARDFPDDYKYAYGYTKKDEWWRLYPLDKNTCRRSHVVSDIHPLSLESTFPGEFDQVIEIIPYDPGPFTCLSCRGAFFEIGHDVVLIHKLPEERTNPYQPIYTNGKAPILSHFKSKNPILLLLAPFCDACLMTLRMLGLLVPETK